MMIMIVDDSWWLNESVFQLTSTMMYRLVATRPTTFPRLRTQETFVAETKCFWKSCVFPCLHGRWAFITWRACSPNFARSREHKQPNKMLEPGARFSKVPKSFRARKATTTKLSHNFNTNKGNFHAKFNAYILLSF